MSVASDLRIFLFFRFLRPVNAGWNLLRFGSQNDGGYLVPEDLENLSQLFSPGVSEQTEFDLHLARMGMDCFLADPVLPSEMPDHEKIHFDNFALGNGTDGSVSLIEWVQSHNLERGNAILQMDIEGAEWQVLLDSRNFLRHFRFMIIELHEIHRIVSGWRNFLPAILTVFYMKFWFDVVHVHLNNVPPLASVHGIAVPKVLEVTFHRKSRRKGKVKKALLPNHLDAPNDPNRQEHPLPVQWRQTEPT